jgi:elongation factor Ts
MVDIEKLKTLRKKTDISLALCKKALEETKNDLKKAEALLLKWGAEKISEKKDRLSTQGAIFSYVHHNKKIATLVELLCETDFVAQNTDFQKLGTELAMQLAFNNAKNLEDFLNQEYIRDPSKKVQDLFKETAIKFGENIKINRFLRWTLGE